MTFTGQVGKIYGIQATTSIASTNIWQGLTNLTLTTPTNVWYDPQRATQFDRVYRVVNGPVSIP